MKTSREQLAADLKKVQRFFDETQQVARLGGWEWIFPSGRVAWTEGIYRIYGLEPYQFDGSFETIVRLTHPEDRAEVERCRDIALIEHQAFDTDIRIQRPDGSIRNIHLRGEPFEGESGPEIRIVGISQDITERKRLEAEIREQFERLKELDRLKTIFVNSVSHEIRTPLTTIMGYIEFLEDEIAGPLTKEQRQFIDQVQEGVARLKRLVDDLLDFARMDAGTFKLKPECIEFGSTVQEVVRSFLPQVSEAHLSMDVSLPEEPLRMMGDPQRIGQVLANLLSNAAKFTPDGGRITVRAWGEGEHVVCEVQDTGVGIAPDDLPKLFNRFSQLESGLQKGGMGLGLSISKALVEAHGGTIGVLSHVGRGSTFWFRLPIKPRFSDHDAP